MAVVQVLLQLIVAASAFQLQLQDVDYARQNHIPGLKHIVSSAKDKAKDAVGNVTDAVQDAASDAADAATDAASDAVSDVKEAVADATGPITKTLGDIADTVGNASSKAKGIAKKLNNAMDKGNFGDIAKAVKKAAANASDIVDSVTSIFEQAKGHSNIFLNMTAASEAAAEAAKMSITVEERSKKYRELKEEVQQTAEESLKEAEVIADKTSEAIDSSEMAFKILDDMVHNVPTNLTLEHYTRKAQEAATEAQEAAETAKGLVIEHRDKQKQADKYLHQTLEAAYSMQAKLNETLKDSATAGALLRAGVKGEVAKIIHATTTEAPTEAPGYSGAGRRSAFWALAVALLAAAPALAAGV